jgi:MFS family permease
MSSPSNKLYRLRGWFVLYFVLKSVVGAVVAAIILKRIHVDRLGHLSKWGFSSSSLFFFSLIVAAIILVIALFIFGQLLLRKNWARVLLLIIAWLTVFSAVFSLLASAQIATINSWVAHWLPDIDWEKVINFDRFQKVFELLFWGYLIAVLQFDAEVKKEFLVPLGDVPS